MTDDPNMTQDFAREIYNKSFYLSTECTLCVTEPSKETNHMDLLMTTAHGQVGYIRIDSVSLIEVKEAEPVASFALRRNAT